MQVYSYNMCNGAGAIYRPPIKHHIWCTCYTTSPFLYMDDQISVVSTFYSSYIVPQKQKNKKYGALGSDSLQIPKIHYRHMM
jgi:hypothetical protein